MTKNEALKLALEALKQIDEAMPFPVAKLAQAAIKEALAQTEQEPVAVVRWNDIGHISWRTNVMLSDNTPLYITPPQRTWVGLTDEDFLEACQIAERGNYLVAFQRIQAKLKEKNT